MSLRFLRVGGAALNQTPLDWKGNRARIVDALERARAAGVQVLCLPELCITGYGCEDAFHSEALAEHAGESLERLLPHTRGLAVALGLPVSHGRALYNCAAMAVDGELRGLVAKQLLAGYGVYYEPRWFQPWPAGAVEPCRVAGREVPLGDLVFDLEGVTVGFEICEDAWGRGQTGAHQPGRRADVLLNPSASHFAFDKHATLQGIVVEGSRMAQAVYVYSNLLGNESGRLLFDGTVMVASNGRMVAEGPRFSYREVELLSAVVDLRANRLERRRLNYPRPTAVPERRTVPVARGLAEPSLDEVRAARTRPGLRERLPVAAPEEAPRPQEARGAPPDRFTEFTDAVALGLWDYMRKSRSRGLIVSISGGVDSASVAVLGWVMVHRARAALGWTGLRERLPDWPERAGAPAAAQEAMARLVTTVYQSTAQSSETTRRAAADLAAALGTRHRELDVQPLVEGYERLAGEALGRKLSWERDDVARQNIQARARSPGIWLLANLEGLLLVCTSNRSEVGVGYATMDGDTSGGVAPIAGANKTFLRAWLRWMERQGPADLGPVPALAAINRQAPTAELRPAARRQTDEADLMPYAVLDTIEQAAIRDRMAPVEVWRTLLATPLPGGPPAPEEAAAYVARFFRLWSVSQWKRERLAPSFHLDDENLDPKTWCRFPILSGSYAEELEALEAEVHRLRAAAGTARAGSGS